MNKEALLELAAMEECMAAWLYEASKGPPIVHTAHEAAVTCVNRAAALKALAAQENEL